MKALGSLLFAAALACVTGCALAADGNDDQTGSEHRQQLREQCRDNPQECWERM